MELENQIIKHIKERLQIANIHEELSPLDNQTRQAAEAVRFEMELLAKNVFGIGMKDLIK